MSDQGFSLATTTEALLALPIGDALTESKEVECWSYGQVFFGRAKAAEASGDGNSAIGWSLLGQLCQIMVQEGNPNEPFRPMLENATGRSLLPCDLDEGTARAVLELARTTEDAELRAKLFDVCWDRLRDVEAARMAVRGYIEAADRLFDPDNWVQYVQGIERALRLARQVRDEDLQESILGAIEGRVIALDGRDPLYMTSHLMELLHEFKHGEPAVLRKIATQAAEAADKQKDFDRARAHLENVRRWARRGGDKDAERNARIAIAASYVSQAKLHSGPGGELAAAHFLESAHEAYRAIPGMRDKAEEVYGQLREQQLRARDAMQEIRSEGIDLSPVIKAARERVSGKPFREALLAFATVTHPTDFAQETETARKIIERFPLQSLLGGTLIDGDGRIIAHRTPGLIADQKQQEQHLWERLVEQVTMGYQIDVEAAIIPAMNQLAFEHSVSMEDMRDLVTNNPFVPSGHEELFAKGFVAGFRWNFPEALSILVPQLENSLRHLLARAGAEVTKRDKMGLQTVIQMGTILTERQDQLEPVLGADIVKELKVLFADQHGPDLRNRIAHGLMPHEGFFSHAAAYAWWFILFLCINPVYRRFAREAPPVNGQPPGESGPLLE